MFCENCGKLIEDDAKFCEHCGSKQGASVQETVAPETEVLSEPVQDVAQDYSAPETEILSEPVQDVAQDYSAPETEILSEPVQDAAQDYSIDATEALQDDVQDFSSPETEVLSDVAEAEPVVEEQIPAANVEESGFAVNDFATPDFEETAEKPKKSFKIPKGLIIAVASVAVVAAAVIVAVTCFDLKGAWIKAFGTNEEYYAYVETKNITEGTNALVKGYGKIFDAFSGDGQSVEGSLSFEVNEDAFKIAEPLIKHLGGSIDKIDGMDDAIKILNNLKLNVASNQKDGLAQTQLGIELSGNELINLDIIMDMLEGEMYMGAPDLADGYLTAETPVSKELLQAYEILYSSELWDAMPSDSDLDAILNRYITVALESIEDVSVEDGEIEVGDITEDCTVIEYDVSEKTVYNMALAVLEAMQEDSDLEDIINNFNEYANDELDADVDMYDELMDAVDEAIDELENQSKKASDEAKGTIVTYVNSDHEIIGRELIAKNGKEEREIASVKTAEDDEFATEVKVNGQVVLSGEGTKSGDTIEQGEYAVVLKGAEILNIELIDYTASVSDYEISGTINITLGKDALNLIIKDSQMKSIVTKLEPALSITLDYTEDSSNVALALTARDETLVKIMLEGEVDSGSSVDIPDDTIDVTDDDEGQEWLESIDFADIKDNVIDSLEDAEVSDDIIEKVTEALEEAEDEYN